MCKERTYVYNDTVIAVLNFSNTTINIIVIIIVIFDLSFTSTRLPKFTEEELSMISGSADFLGINL